MPSFSKMTIMGQACKGRFIRLDLTTQHENLKDNRRVRIDAGSIGYCYSAPGVIHVGFSRSGQRPAVNPVLVDPMRFDYCVTFDPPMIPWLSIETP